MNDLLFLESLLNRSNLLDPAQPVSSDEAAQLLKLADVSKHTAVLNCDVPLLVACAKSRMARAVKSRLKD